MTEAHQSPTRQRGPSSVSLSPRHLVTPSRKANMPQLCTKCSRANPPEAVYCHFDGFVLGGHERRGGPVSVGKQPFQSPFVFPTGRTCRNFDELALACQAEWTAACGLLRDGFFES